MGASPSRRCPLANPCPRCGGFLRRVTERGAGPMHPSNCQAKLARWPQAAGIPFRVTPHMMRHTWATDLANGGADPKDLRQYLGWRQYQTAIHDIHRSGKAILPRIAQAQPALPVGHVEDRSMRMAGQACHAAALPALEPGRHRRVIGAGDGDRTHGRHFGKVELYH